MAREEGIRVNKAVIALTVALTACANVSPVMPTGNNSYMISVVSHSQFSEALIKANHDAEAYCASQGKKVVINSADTAGTKFMSSSSARVQFSCYSADDPHYQQSVLHQDNGVN
jgi:hypothetical protein